MVPYLIEVLVLGALLDRIRSLEVTLEALHRRQRRPQLVIDLTRLQRGVGQPIGAHEFRLRHSMAWLKSSDSSRMICRVYGFIF